MKREREPTREEFDKLLLWLDPNCDEAGNKLNLFHRRLTKIFISRGCVDAETLADEVVNRVAVRIDTVRNSYSDPLRCFIGFLGKVYKEYLRELLKESQSRPPEPPRPPEELEREDECLQKCLAELNPHERNVVVRYFQGEKRQRIIERQKLAAELNLTANALRIQAHRLRKRTIQCLLRCLDEI